MARRAEHSARHVRISQCNTGRWPPTASPRLNQALHQADERGSSSRMGTNTANMEAAMLVRWTTLRPRIA
jgi:hypothetical protein